jgi:hypothetical protein
MCMEMPKEIIDQLDEFTHLERPRIKQCERKCEDCDLLVINRVCQHRFHSKRKKMYAHWRSKCLSCGFYKHPGTGVYDVTNGTDNYQVHYFFERFFHRYK